MIAGLVHRLQKNAVSSLFAECCRSDSVDILHSRSSGLLLDLVVLSLLQDRTVSIPKERDLPLCKRRNVVLGNDKGTLRLRVCTTYHLQSLLVLRDVIEGPESVDAQVSSDYRPVSRKITGGPCEHADSVRRSLLRKVRQYDPALKSAAPALHDPAARRHVVPLRAERARCHICLFAAERR